MADDVLKNISNRLNNTIRQTNELFSVINNKDLNTLGSEISGFLSGTKLKSIDSVNAPDKKWSLPYTVPVTKLSPKAGNKEAGATLLIPETLSGNGPVESFEFAKNDGNDFGHQVKLDHKFEGWSEVQKRVFLKFVAESENKMRMESLRLQDEYNKQLASKLAIVKNELYESNRNNLVELQQMRLEKERWSLEESEAKNALSSLSTALDSLQKAYDNLRAELDDKDFHINNLNGQLSNYERLVDSLRSDNSTLQTELHDKSEHVNRLQNDVSDAYLRLELECSKFTTAENELQTVKMGRKELVEQIKNLKVQLDSLTLKNKFIATEKETLVNRNTKLEQELIDLNREVLELQTRVRSFEVSESSKVAALEEKLDSLNLQLKSAQVELLAVDKRAEVERLQSQLGELKHQLKQANNDNDALYKENILVNKKLDQEKELVKQHLNDLYESKCKVHTLRSEVKTLREKLALVAKHLNRDPNLRVNSLSKHSSFSDSNEVDLSFLNDFNANKSDVKRRDLFSPTMFDGPDEETQAKIDELEKKLTDLHLEKDRLESEMTRCNIGPGSPTIQRRQHFLLEGKVAETMKKINEVSGEIKTLYNG